MRWREAVEYAGSKGRPRVKSDFGFSDLEGGGLYRSRVHVDNSETSGDEESEEKVGALALKP